MELRQAAATLAAFALIGGLLQILASVVLGMARIDALTVASQEGPTYYLIATVAALLGGVALWVLRKRPLVAALAFVTWQAAILWPLSRRMSVLGLALHGEFILHHFVAIASALTCATLAWLHLRDRRREPGAWVVALAIAVCVLAGLLGHLADARDANRLGAAAHAVAAVAALCGLVVWTGLELRRAPRAPARWAAVALVVPLLARVASVGPRALDHAPIPMGLRGPFLALLVAAAVALTVLLRPRPPRGVGIAMTALAGLSTATLYLVYRRAFAEVEDGLGGLAQSILGFNPPYPEYLSTPVIVAAMLGAFLALQTAGGALTSEDARDRGLGLAVVLVAGVGWSNPQLVLMSTAGALLFLADLDEGPTAVRAPALPVADILAAVAAREGLQAAQIAALQRGTTLHAVRGEIHGVTVDLRAQVGRGAPRIGGRIGVVGRTRADVSLQPGGGGERLAHPLGHSHRAVGSVRTLEHHGDELLDACLPFPTLRLGLWPGGAEFDLGTDQANVDDANLGRLLRTLARSFAD